MHVLMSINKIRRLAKNGLKGVQLPLDFPRDAPGINLPRQTRQQQTAQWPVEVIVLQTLGQVKMQSPVHGKASESWRVLPERPPLA